MSDLVLLENPHFIVDLMYARANNMLNCAVYLEIGQGTKAYMHKDMKEALLSLVPDLEKMHCKMRICDAYRSPLAHKKMLEIIPRAKAHFFAETPNKSNHCHGTSVDVCLTDLNGNNLVYPTEVDAYTPKFAKQVAEGNFAAFQKHLLKARHDYVGASEEAIRNRQALKNMMESHGFESIEQEWWHYNLKGWQNYPLIDENF